MIEKRNKRIAARLVVIVIVALGASGFGGVESLFAPKASLWEKWEAHNASSTQTVDHSAWQSFLTAFVGEHEDGVNRVAYGSVEAPDKAALDGYIARLTTAPVANLARDEQLAYWVNLYNALTVKVVLAHYPVDTIRDIDISPGLFSDGPWDKKLVEIDGEAVSLNDIEHRILRPIWRDPRIHYALNCASIGCPNLLKTAFTGANAEQLLDAAARGYINDPRGVRKSDERVIVSSIYAWFTEDFGGDVAGVIAHLKKYASPEVATILDEAVDLEDAYDWTLNDARKN